MTLIEIMVVVGIIGVMVTLASMKMADWFANQQVKAAARAAGDAFLLARSEAIRTGSNHMVFFGSPGDTDPAGNPIEGPGGWVPILILNDGPAATANCQIDPGEAVRGISPIDNVSWGVSHASVRAPDDPGKAPFSPPQASGGTFADPANNAVNWLLFRSDGIPVSVAFSGGTCGQVGGTGSGGGALYVTNGDRDYAAVLSPLGGVRVHAWDGNAWSD